MDYLDRFPKNPQVSNFINFRAVEAELFHADEQTDKTKVTVAFRNFTNVPKSGLSCKSVDTSK